MGPSSLPRVQGRHRRGNKWRYAAPVLGYSVAAALAVVAATSAHYGQLRSEDVGSSSVSDHTRAHAERQQDYLPPIGRSAGGAGESAPPAPPTAFQPPPAPTEPAHAQRETASPRTPSDEENAQSAPSDPEAAPVRADPQPTETSEPATTSEPSTTSEPTETSEPAETSEPTSEPTEPSEEPQPPVLKRVDGVVQGLTDPVLGLLG